MKFRLITTVWGPRFADLFLRITVRSLLGEGNIDAFGERHQAVYSIFTTPETAEQLRKSPLFQRLENAVEIDFVLLGPADIDPRVTSSHWVGWRRGAETAERKGEIAFFIIADMLYATKTLRRWVERFEAGYRAIWTSTTQAVLETAIREVEAKFPPASVAPISMSNDEVIDLTIRHLHPLIICMFRDSRRASRHPEVVFAEIPGEGLAERAIGSHLMCVDPSFFRTSDAFSPLNRFEAIAFEEATGVGLEPLLKSPDLYARVAPLDGDRLSNMGSWLDYNCTPSDLIEGMRTYRFSRAGPRNDEGFQRASARLGVFVCQVRITGAIYRVVREMRRAGCVLAARIAASAHYAGRLRRHWRTRGRISVLVPNDTAMAEWGLDQLHELLRVGNERQLARAALEHVFVGRQELAAGDEVRLLTGRVMAATDRALAVERPARVLAGPIECDDCTIYVIDRVLLPPAAATENPRPAALPSSWSVHPARVRRARAEAPEDKRDAESVPATATLPQEATSLPWTCARLVLGSGFRVLRRVPGASRVAERIRRRLASLHGELRAAVLRREIAALPAGSATALAGTMSAPAPAAIEGFLDLQRARATFTLLEILEFYRSRVLDVVPDLPALTLVESCIREAGLSPSSIEERLERLLEHEPNFAEAWYELGDMRLGNKDYAGAIACFDRCLTTRQAIPVPPGRTSCDLLAASAKACALESSGCLEMAAEVHRRAARLGSQCRLARVAHGRLLRRLGKTLDAAAEFDAGMESDETSPTPPPMPHDFSQLAERLLHVFGAEDPTGRSTVQQGEKWS